MVQKSRCPAEGKTYIRLFVGNLVLDSLKFKKLLEALDLRNVRHFCAILNSFGNKLFFKDLLSVY